MTVTQDCNEQQAATKNFFETLGKEFNGGSFYGLEYILDELLNNEKNCSIKVSVDYDWFGLRQ